MDALGSDFLRFDDSPANWMGPDLAATPSRWVYELTAAELADLQTVVAEHGSRTDSLTNLRREDVDMPRLGITLQRLRAELLDGVGIGLIRGLPVERCSLRQAATAFWAVGLYLGEPLSQNAAGHVLGHVRDLGFDYAQPSARGYQTTDRLPYHCDAGDVVGLLSLQTSRAGGLSSAVSSTALYHAMVDRWPVLAAILMQPTYRDRRDEIPAGRDAWYEMPVFNPHRGRLFGHYVRSTINKAQRFTEVPRITDEQIHAFDRLDTLASSKAFRLDMEFRAGDMQFVCNHWILHSRTRFEDWPDPLRRRHLLRLWLGCPGAPPVPDAYVNQQGLTASDRPAGIRCPGGELHAPLEVVDGGAGDSGIRKKPDRT